MRCIAGGNSSGSPPRLAQPGREQVLDAHPKKRRKVDHAAELQAGRGDGDQRDAHDVASESESTDEDDEDDTDRDSDEGDAGSHDDRLTDEEGMGETEDDISNDDGDDDDGDDDDYSSDYEAAATTAHVSRAPRARHSQDHGCEREYEVEAVLGMRLVHGRLYYLVHWRGYAASDRTWEPEAHLAKAQDAIDEYCGKQ